MTTPDSPSPSPSPSSRPAPRRRHLLTPEELASGRSTRVVQRGGMSLSTVQTWVMSTLAVSTGLHMAAAVVWAAHYVEERSSAIGLLVIALAFGLLAMASGLLIHRRSLVHPLMLVGVLPALVGAWWVLG